MGSACVPWLCLLLLALPTSHAGIAVPRANLAEEANGSSIIKTTVTVYYCKNYGGEECKTSDYTGFEIIGKTENETFSNENISLVTSEMHITMCFQQENMCRDGAYVIFWEKAGGVGDPRGILKCEAPLEDRRHSIIEEGKICCETETDHANPHSVLKCYIGRTDEKNTNTMDGINYYGDLGNHQYLVGENNQTGLTATLLVVGICAGAAALLSMYCYYKRRTRKHQGPIILLAQTHPD
ncbi:uncharacterized protein LOC110407425 isoform X2 [Numida meleagris]|uniref:uncharacterized protein LOC110407425 isoform X2 n=1 Tax=Numida meleagris TaxID=8996 RepID=UPI000B3DC472|nr:uncharacterized protein LOC110407425 isoform X2 [Numida meleagris]